MHRVLLAYKSGSGSGDGFFTTLLPVGLGYIHALLRSRGHRSRVANFSGSGWKEISNLVAAEAPTIVGISQFTHNRFESLKLAALIRKILPGSLIVLGGPHASSRYHHLLTRNPHVDAVVLGEGEMTFAELVEQFRGARDDLYRIPGLAVRSEAGGSLLTENRPRLRDLDSLPFPALHLEGAIGVDLRSQLEFIVTSRGCPASCRFCSSPGFWRRGLRFRSPESMVEEIRYIRDRYGLIYFSFRDDTFTWNRERVLAFCRLLIEQKVYILWNCQSRVSSIDEEMLVLMKQAGCECVQLGVESGSRRILDLLGKNITPDQVRCAAAAVRKAGINLSIYLINGVPGETGSDLEATLALVDELKPHDGQVSPLAYYPGTDLFAAAVASGEVPEDLFEVDRQPALLARHDRAVGASTARILKRLQTVGENGRFTEPDFRAQKKLLGFCHATSIMCGEYFEGAGDLLRAEKEYREVIDRQPDNPWGWLMLGELYASCGREQRAAIAFQQLKNLVPNAQLPHY